LHAAYAAAARIVADVLAGTSLSDALSTAARAQPDPTIRAAAQDLSHTALRAYGVLDEILAALWQREPRDRNVAALLRVALADARARPEKAYVAVDQAVRAVRLLEAHTATGLVNAVLRNYLRRANELETKAQSTLRGRWQHPEWWIELLRASYPDQWPNILAAGNTHPPMTLRANRRRTTVADYLELLHARAMVATPLGDQAIRLARPVPVTALPGFSEGLVSVQDLGAQLAAPLLDVQPGHSVLDACAAPGGKTAAILELVDCEMLALDDDPPRCARIREALDRLGLAARVSTGDAGEPRAWWDGRAFDRVLLDAPCSASGIVRRHSDIKWLRRATDLTGYGAAQSRLLQALWRVLRPGGKLLYATCSVFPVENQERVDAFLRAQPDARQAPLPGLARGQLLPCDANDGFFYALLEKR
jgi:16S rRNA (cytosine967-C5)-methyltransferase